MPASNARRGSLSDYIGAQRPNISGGAVFGFVNCSGFISPKCVGKNARHTIWQPSRRKSYEEAVADVDRRLACRRYRAGVRTRRIELGELVFAADRAARQETEAQEVEEWC